MNGTTEIVPPNSDVPIRVVKTYISGTNMINYAEHVSKSCTGNEIHVLVDEHIPVTTPTTPTTPTPSATTTTTPATPTPAPTTPSATTPSATTPSATTFVDDDDNIMKPTKLHLGPLLDVLLVEDDEKSRKSILMYILQHISYRVTIVCDARHVKYLYESSPSQNFDLVFMDYNFLYIANGKDKNKLDTKNMFVEPYKGKYTDESKAVTNNGCTAARIIKSRNPHAFIFSTSSEDHLPGTDKSLGFKTFIDFCSVQERNYNKQEIGRDINLLNLIVDMNAKKTKSIISDRFKSMGKNSKWRTPLSQDPTPPRSDWTTTTDGENSLTPTPPSSFFPLSASSSSSPSPRKRSTRDVPSFFLPKISNHAKSSGGFSSVRRRRWKPTVRNTRVRRRIRRIRSTNPFP
jgi:hypothetical protein